MANMLSWLTGRDDQTEQPSPVKYDDGQPSLRAYNPTPSERVGNWIQDLLMAGGAQAYPAGHVAHGVRDLLSMSPLGIGMSAADLLHAKSAGDPMGAAAAAIGMVPGLKPEVQAVRQGIRAYHGSPHDFDKFDLSKIGTGEGAQAYGHGLYFAENEHVAKEYKNMLGTPAFNAQDLAGKIQSINPKAFGTPLEEAASWVQGRSGNIEQTLADWRNLRGKYDLTEHEKTVQNYLEHWQKTGIDYSPGGKMYEVNINAKPEQFLDWDRSLREQPQAVQKALDDIGIPLHPRSKEEPASGKDAYWWLNPDKRAASAELAEAGIPGIRYLDQGSRPPMAIEKLKTTIADLENSPNPNAGVLGAYKAQLAKFENMHNPTSNYVLFNDQLVDIMRKYGLAAPAAAGAASYAMQPQEAQAGKAQAAQFQQAAPLSDRINQMIDSLQWGDQWQGRMRLPLERKVNNMLGESVWPPIR